MYKIFSLLFIMLILLIPIGANASYLYTFKSDYDTNKYITEQIYFDIPYSVPQDWYQLKTMSQYLSIGVDWDSKTHEIVIDNFPLQYVNSNMPERRYKSYKLPDSLKIKDGVTYCSPEFLVNLLGGFGFLYNGQVYYFAGESVQSKLINPGASKVFKPYVITSMYEMKLKLPNEYKFVRKHLTGGIECIQTVDSKIPAYAKAYVYPSHTYPCCYIVGDKVMSTTLASYIGHEAYHVWQYRTNGNDGIIEHDALLYGNTIQEALKIFWEGVSNMNENKNLFQIIRENIEKAREEGKLNPEVQKIIESLEARAKEAKEWKQQ